MGATSRAGRQNQAAVECPSLRQHGVPARRLDPDEDRVRRQRSGELVRKTGRRVRG